MSPSVLVVDDHAGFRSSVRNLMQSDGWWVVADVGDSVEALRAARRLRPDVVLLDICLAVGDPGGDGIDLAHALAALTDPPTVVLVSTRTAQSFGDRLATAPIRGFIPKSGLSLGAVADLLGGG